jgi:hypothetical protein
LLGAALFATIVPVSPLMPSVGLDPSWRLAINRATADGLQFGRDIVFTYGPLGAVLTRLYEPGLRLLTSSAAVFLAAGCITATLLALRARGPAVHLGGAVAVVVLTSYSLDSLVLVYPLVGAFAITELPARRWPRLSALVLIFAPLGLLPITKLSLAPAAVAGIAAGGALLLRRRDRIGAAVVLVAPVASLLGWWVTAGQVVGSLPGYFRATWPVVIGYSEAMSLHDTSRLAPGVVTGMYLVASTAVTVALLRGARPRDERLVLGAATALTLFVVYKAGYVRADVHMEIGALAILAVGALVTTHVELSATAGRCLGVGIVVLALVTYLATTVTSPVSDATDHTIRPVGDLLRGDLLPAAMRRRYDAALRDIRTRFPLPATDGTSDLYTSALTLMFAGGGAWSPRPVIQSYSAYTAGLARLDAEHLEGLDAPRTIFLRIQPIDRRLAALEDGASWVPMLENYDLGGRTSGHLDLRRRSQPRAVTLGTETHTFTPELGQPVALPGSSNAWLASFDVRPTRLGLLRTALWKPPQLVIELQTADGERFVRRFVPAMARAEFVLSPYVGDTKDFRSWFLGRPRTSSDRRVISVRLEVEVPGGIGASMAWRSSYTLRVRSLAFQG